MDKILIVDDDPSLRQLYKLEFEEEGYEVEVAATADEALARAAEKRRIDVVVLDIRLGEANGLDLMRQMLHQHPDMRIVLNSAYATHKCDFASWSADRYVVKSSNLTELREAVRDALAAA